MYFIPDLRLSDEEDHESSITKGWLFSADFLVEKADGYDSVTAGCTVDNQDRADCRLSISNRHKYYLSTIG